MKKLLWPLCVIAILLSAARGGFALAYLTEEVTFDQIKSSGCGFPNSPAHTITILHGPRFRPYRVLGGGEPGCISARAGRLMRPAPAQPAPP